MTIPSCLSFRVIGLSVFAILLLSPAVAQTEKDSTRVLEDITIEAYAANRPPNKVPASVGIVQRSDLERFSSTSILPAFNMLPGVRMEERSPGSYRFSIRGSLLRSPFGVRNVKFYWNGLPLTDGGGNTYLNMIDLFAVSKAEVIKGPAGSLYGAGTGGAVLLRSPSIATPGVGLTAQYGSFAALRYGAVVEAKSDAVESRIQFVHQQSDGYREQSAMKRNAFNADMNFFLDPSTVMSVTVLYTDLNYQTPGGLTESQFQLDPRQARPGTPASPGAVDQQAAVHNTTWYSGVTLEHQWSSRWTSSLGMVGSNTEFKNPAIRNYEARSETNGGARLSNDFQHHLGVWKGRLTFGGEYQYFFSPVKVTNNVNGLPGNVVISNDEITSDLAMGFFQEDIDLRHGLQLTLGASVNYLHYEDKRLALTPTVTNNRKFNPVLSPRIAILKSLSSSLSVYISASKGFSPPSVAEVIPSTGIYNPTLNPETGWSYEAGVSGTLAQTINLHLALYDFRLTNTIVIQRDASGADYFVNAGETEQQGIEMDANWSKTFSSFLQTLRISGSLTYNHYTFGHYINDGNDYSGNDVTGIAPVVAVLGIDLVSRSGLYSRFTGNFVDRIPLNDANTDYASDYLLLGVRGGYRFGKKIPVDLFLGVDNILNQRYSLGNDLNAAGKRYYNAAPTLNVYVGFITNFSFAKK